MNKVNLGEDVQRYAKSRPDAVAATLDGRTRTYRELDARAGQLAAMLKAVGVGVGSRVAHLDVNSLEGAELLVATARLGATYLPLNWRLSTSELAGVLNDAQPRVLVAGPAFASSAAAVISELDRKPALITYDDSSPWCGGSSTGTRHATQPDDVLMQIYTSGTTGVPKGVMLTAANIAAMTDHAPVTFKLDTNARILVALPMFHIGGLAPLIGALHVGATSVIVAKIVPERLLDTLEHERVTSAVLVPTVLQTLTEVPGAATRNWTQLQRINYGGSPIPSATLNASIRTFGCEFAQLYGSTESVAAVTRLDPDDHDLGGPREYLLRSAGRPLKHHELQIIDTEGFVLPPNEVGEIRVRGPLVFPGYYRRQAETSKVLASDGWYRTGDAGFVDDDGYVYVTDRVKDMIITGGENVYSVEVEDVLAKHPDVAQVAVVGLPHPKWVEIVAAVIVPRPDSELDPAEVVDLARRNLAGYKVPRVIDIVSELPATALGKVRKQELKERYRGFGQPGMGPSPSWVATDFLG